MSTRLHDDQERGTAALSPDSSTEECGGEQCVNSYDDAMIWTVQGGTAEEAQAYLNRLSDSLRYQRDVWY